MPKLPSFMQKKKVDPDTEYKLINDQEERNPKKAIKQYQKIASKNPRAKLRLAFLHSKGMYGLPKDEKKAFALTQEVANGGNRAANLRLAQMHEEGIGTKKNLQAAREIYERVDAKAYQSRIARIDMQIGVAKAVQNNAPIPPPKKTSTSAITTKLGAHPQAKVVDLQMQPENPARPSHQGITPEVKSSRIAAKAHPSDNQHAQPENAANLAPYGSHKSIAESAEKISLSQRVSSQGPDNEKVIDHISNAFVADLAKKYKISIEKMPPEIMKKCKIAIKEACAIYSDNNKLMSDYNNIRYEWMKSYRQAVAGGKTPPSPMVYLQKIHAVARVVNVLMKSGADSNTIDSFRENVRDALNKGKLFIEDVNKITDQVKTSSPAVAGDLKKEFDKIITQNEELQQLTVPPEASTPSMRR